MLGHAVSANALSLDHQLVRTSQGQNRVATVQPKKGDFSMVNLHSNDVVHLALLGGGLPVVGITVQAPFVLAAAVISLSVQAPPH